jgi:uncharacterized membrane protein
MKLTILSSLLIFVGLLQSFGYVLGNKTIKQLGLITVASPLPIVFTQQKGFLETFALDFTLVYEKDGKEERLKITPELYAKLDKPYNYRNVLGAAISYGPILPKPLAKSVLDYAFVEPAVLSKAFHLGALKKVHLELNSKTKGVNKQYILDLGEER